MNADFPRVLTLLRKERGISQKLAASKLGISQALLSHYEKGIRECGLDFLIRCADFYGVSCDYMLGRSPDRTGSKLTVEDIPEPVSYTHLASVIRCSIICAKMYAAASTARPSRSAPLSPFGVRADGGAAIQARNAWSCSSSAAVLPSKSPKSSSRSLSTVSCS